MYTKGAHLRAQTAFPATLNNNILDGIHVLDGGLASELEYRDARIDTPLWSAQVLEDEPEKVAAVHRAYVEAGAQCIATCSYQVSRMGYIEVGLTAEQADAALLRSVQLARAAVAEFSGLSAIESAESGEKGFAPEGQSTIAQDEPASAGAVPGKLTAIGRAPEGRPRPSQAPSSGSRRPLVAGSLGPYGAALHNGGEYTGNYDCSYQDLVRFHRERIEVFAKASDLQRPDLLAFETFPSIQEVRAVGEALSPWPDLRVWFSFSCRDEQHVSHGERVADCAALVASFPQTLAVGVNCVPPPWIPSLIAELRGATNMPVIVYPNSGEGWDAAHRCWTGVSDVTHFGALAAEWFQAGAQIVGGCCRTRPAHTREVAKAAQRVAGAFIRHH
jgi:homocysteine S-methyltransferase